MPLRETAFKVLVTRRSHSVWQDGGLAVSQGQLLADFDIGYVLVQAPVDQQLAGLLDDVGGLRPYSITPNYSIWQLITPPARVSVVEWVAPWCP